MRNLSPLLTLVAVLGSCTPLVLPMPAEADHRPPLTWTGGRNLVGINLNYGTTDDYSEDRLFADAMKTARPWNKGNTFENPAVPAALDAHFWPTEDACLCVMDLRRNEGTYRCSFEGTATVKPGPWGLGGPGSIQNVVYHPVTGRTTFEIVLTQGVSAMTLAFTDTRGGIRDLRIMRPKTRGGTESYPEGTLFTDQILTLVSKFRVIRFMDYLRTNGNQLEHWSDRPQPDDASFASGYRKMVDTVWTNPDTGEVTTNWSSPGGCYEDAVELCNQAGCDLWLNVPLRADDDFVRNLARLVKDRLRADLNVYVEYSNEMWNTAPGFSQGNQNHDLAKADVAAGVTPALNPYGDTNDWYWAWRRVGRRTVEISNLFREVWGDEALPAPGKASPRVRPVLEGQQGNGAGFLGPILMYLDRSFPHPVNHYLYGGGGSGYYNPDDPAGLSVDALWSSGSMDPARWLAGPVKDEAVLARAFGLKRICYEGGPSFDTGSKDDAVRERAWGDPRMQQNLVDHVDRAWSAADGDLFVFYASAGGYQWGFTRDLFNLNTPKLRAIDQLNAQFKAAPSVGRLPPFSVDGAGFDGNMAYSSYGYPQGTSYVVGREAYLTYAFRTDTSQAVSAVLHLGVSTAPFWVWCDGIPVVEVPALKTEDPIAVALGRLSPGLHALVLRTDTSGLRVNRVEFTLP